MLAIELHRGVSSGSEFVSLMSVLKLLLHMVDSSEKVI